MTDVEKLSDAELRTKLMEFGFPVMPITGTTRKLMVKKLKLLMENKNKIANDNRRSLARYSSEEESDTDAKPSKKEKNRRATMAVPQSSPLSKATGVLRKSLRRNDNDDTLELSSQLPTEKNILKTKTTTVTKVVKTVQDEFDTGSDSEPEIVTNSYDSPAPRFSNSFENKNDSSTFNNFSPSSPFRFQSQTSKYTSPKATSSSSNVSSSFTSPHFNKPASPSRFTTYFSTSNSGNVALDRLNQIRSRLSLGSTAYDRSTQSPVVDSNEDKVETPFLSNFTRRLSQLSANSPKPDYDIKNDIIKEHDTNGAGSYVRGYLGRPARYREVDRDYYQRHEGSIVKNNMVSITLLLVAALFFILVGVTYYGIRSSDSAVETIDYHVPRCVKSDSKPSVNCILDENLGSATSLKNILLPELTKRSIASYCSGDSSIKPYMTEQQVIEFQKTNAGMDVNAVKRDLQNLQVLIFKNPEWGMSVIQTDGTGDISEANKLSNMDEVFYYRPNKSIGLAVLHPNVPWRCSIFNKIYALFNTFVALIMGFFALYFGNRGYKYFKFYQQQKKDELCAMVERIIDALQSNSANEGDNFLVINHVRDMILPITDRKRLENTWTKAVKFINENESRVRTEVQVVQGEPFEVWRWLGSPNLSTSSSPRSKTWQGQAFEMQVGSVNSLPCSPTPCLKIRGMVDDNDHNYHTVREAVLNKCAHQCRILHCAIDGTTKCVYIKCADQADAAVAYRNLHGWWYAGHLVTVKYLRLERYMQRFPDSPVSGPPYLKSVAPPTDRSS